MIKICVTLIVGIFALIGSATFGILNLIRILNLAKTEIAVSVWAVSAVDFDVVSFIAACLITTKIAKKIEHINDEQTKVLTKTRNYRIGTLESDYQKSKCR